MTSKEKLVKYIIWLIFTFLYLVGSELVEFRYFAVPFVLLSYEITNRDLMIDVEKMRKHPLGTSYRMIWITIGKIMINIMILFVFIGRPFG